MSDAAKPFLAQHAVPAGVTSTRWWWVRHAPVREDGGNIYGQSDIGCDCSDRQVFAGVAKFLPRDAIWFASNLKRTHQTAEAIWAAGFPKPEALHQDAAFAEQNLGEWQGRNRAEFFANRPPQVGAYWFAPAHERAPGGESFDDLYLRTTAGILRVGAAHAGRDIICLSHGGPIKAAIAFALGLEAQAGFSFTIDNCSVTRLDYLAGPEHSGWRIPMINQQPWISSPAHDAMHQPAGPEIVNKLA